MIRKVTFGFAIVFAAVVAIGYVPSFIQVQGGERLMFGLFQISLIDDVTHGMTALAALVAGATSRKLSLLFLTAFGFYYGLDAVFYLTYGVLSGNGVVANLLLNAPHVGIATAMLGIAYGLAPKLEASSA